MNNKNEDRNIDFGNIDFWMENKHFLSDFREVLSKKTLKSYQRLACLLILTSSCHQASLKPLQIQPTNFHPRNLETTLEFLLYPSTTYIQRSRREH
jgi:hypothetical protein